MLIQFYPDKLLRHTKTNPKNILSKNHLFSDLQTLILSKLLIKRETSVEN